MSRIEKILIAVIVFISIAFVFKFSGAHSITGYASLPLVQNSDYSYNTGSNFTKKFSLEIYPEFFEFNTTENETSTQQLILKNTGTSSLSLEFSFSGKLYYFAEKIPDLKIEQNETKTIYLKFKVLSPKQESYSGYLNIFTYKKFTIPITIHVSKNSSAFGSFSESSMSTYSKGVGSAGGIFFVEKETNLTFTNETFQSFVLTLKNLGTENVNNISFSLLNSEGTLIFTKTNLSTGESRKINFTLFLNETTSGLFYGKINAISLNSTIAEIPANIFARVREFSGTVSSVQSEQPIPDSEIFVSSFSAKTDSKGKFKMYVPFGDFSALVVAPGFKADKSAAFEILGNNNITYNFRLNPAFVIAKIIQMPEKVFVGKPFNVTIEILDRNSYVDALQPGIKNLKLLTYSYFLKYNSEFISLSENDVNGYEQKLFDINRNAKEITISSKIYPNLNSKHLKYLMLNNLLANFTAAVLDGSGAKISTATLPVEIRFLEAKFLNNSLELCNYASRKIKDISISASFLKFESTSEISPYSCKTLSFIKPEAAGHYSDTIKIFSILSANSYYDGEVSEYDTLPVNFTVGSDIAFKTLSFPDFSKTETQIQINAVLQNLGEFPENISAALKISGKNYFLEKNFTSTLTPHEEFQISFLWNTSGLETGIYEITFEAQSTNDFNTANNKISKNITLLSEAKPENLVLVIIDGAGWKYFNEETTPEIMQLSKYSFVSENFQTQIPSTTESHSIIFTSYFNENYDWSAFAQSVAERQTLIDSAHSKNYLAFGVMGKGDFPEAVKKFDAILHIPANDFNSELNASATLPPKILSAFQNSSNLSLYQNLQGTKYNNQNSWIKDSAKTILKTLENSHKFILILNFPGTDSAAHEAGIPEYKKTLRETSAYINEIYATLAETGLLNRTILLITADHGMSESEYGNGKHADIYTHETLNVPFILTGPSIERKISYSLRKNDAIFPTIAELLNLSKPEGITGESMKEIFSSIRDIGIVSLENQNSGNLVYTKVHLKNFGSFAGTNELCITIALSGFSQCSSVELNANEETEKFFTWSAEENKTYKITASLSNSDDNKYSKVLETIFSTGLVHNLGIEKISTERDSENPLKIIVKTQIKNYGNFTENFLSLRGKVSDEKPRAYGPYNDTISVSKTVRSSWTLKKNGWLNITFEITNYSSFSEDSYKENNIKTIMTYLSAYG